ncbi:hypothetical protein R1flu_027976 [Riccia fluitans]|uniref:Glutamine amidotransferase type-2 domain-containing protein n=1 Tax=Riccia fluitans TaxID=41844 RepID=A0ABD1XPD6_9MARC
MCGIGLIVAGVPIDGQFSPDDVEASGFCCYQELKATHRVLHPNHEELCRILSRRGPDRIGGRNLLLSLQSQYLENVEVETNSPETLGSGRFSCEETIQCSSLS